MTRYEELRQELHHRGKFASSKDVKNYPPAFQLNPRHQIIKMKFDLPTKTVEAELTTYLNAAVDGPKTLKLDAMDMNIEKVEGVSNWTHDGEFLSISWNNTFSQGEEREITIKYTIASPIAGLYFSFPDKEFPDKPEYCVMDVESQRARYVFPSVDHISVRSSFDYYLTAPEKYIAMANGKLMGEEKHEDGTKTTHWYQAFPCPNYLATLAVGDFIEYKDEAVSVGKEPIPVAYYATKKFKVEDLKRSFAKTPEFLKWHWEKFNCSLEWDKYYQIVTPHYMGAMENVSLVTWGEFGIADPLEAEEFQYIIDDVNVHEMSHSWFGDMIVCKEFSHAWLKESWATYVENLYFEDIYGEEHYQYRVHQDFLTYKSEADGKYARPIVTNNYDSSWDMFDMHLYPGGGVRLHMLRQMLGDGIFLAAVKDYLQTFKGKLVETVDFRRKLEDHSGLNLEAFFEQWFYSPGYPTLKCGFDYDEEHKLGKISLSQEQVNEEKGIGVFKFPLTVAWEDKAGVINEKDFKITEKSQTLYFTSETKPQYLRINPKFTTIMSVEFNPGDDMLKRQLVADDIVGRTWAANELAKTGKAPNLDAIAEAYRKETFFGAKKGLAKALKSAENFHAIRLICTLIGEENDPMVVESIIELLEGVKDKLVYDTMVTYLSREKVLNWAGNAALKVIGSQRTEEAYNFLTTYNPVPSYNNAHASGIISGIGKIRSEKAIKFLMEKIPYGKIDEEVRPQAVFALIDAIKWADKPKKDQVVEDLVALLRKETEEKFIFRCLRALSNLPHPEVPSLMKGLKTRMATQEYSWVEKSVAKLSAQIEGKSPDKALTEKIEKLIKSVTKLTERIEKLEQTTKKE